MNDKKNYELFPGKSLSNIFEDIYTNSKKTKSQVDTLIIQLKPFVKNLESAILIVPLIREYMEVGVRNDDQLVKLAETIQRLLKTDTNDHTSILSDAEKDQILSNVDDYTAQRNNDVEKIEKLDKQVEKIKKELLDDTDDKDKKE